MRLGIAVKKFPGVVSLALTIMLAACEAPPPTSTLIENALIMDGSGERAFTAAVRIDGDRIIEVGELTALSEEKTVDAAGMILAPGFIDTHSHHDGGMADHLDMLAVVSQGITTIIRGADGSSGLETAYGYISQEDFNQQFTNSPAAVNVASFSPHGSVRFAIMGDNFRRHASDDEIAAMQALVEADMRHGALGLSTGLEYMPGIFSSIDEVIALAKVAAANGGRYASHLRDEDDLFLDAVDEIIRIGREADIPVHISHIKLADKKYWGTTGDVLRKLDAARDSGVEVTADIYPYLYWHSLLAILFPDRDYTNREVAQFTFERTTAPETLIITSFAANPAYDGLSIAQIARLNEQDVETTLLQLAQASDQYLQENGVIGDSIIAKGMTEDDVASFMRWEYTNICSDGGYGGGHPRGYGSFPRVLSRYVDEEAGFSTEVAIAKMTGLSAANAGIGQRGLIKPGYFADLVLFDPETIRDHATFEESERVSTGIQSVWVNGKIVFIDGATTGLFPGRIVSMAATDKAD
jgi:N-acyl-D-amino-acid deacylase